MVQSQKPGNLEKGFQVFQVPRFPGFQVSYEPKATWKPRKPRKPGNLGNLETWKPGNLENLEPWKPGNLETQKTGRAYGRQVVFADLHDECLGILRI